MEKGITTLAARYDYVSRTSLGEMTGEVLIEKSLEFVKKWRVPDR